MLYSTDNLVLDGLCSVFFTEELPNSVKKLINCYVENIKHEFVLNHWKFGLTKQLKESADSLKLKEDI